MFAKQVKRAKASYAKQSRLRANREFDSRMQRVFDTKSFARFVDEAYRAKRGYAIRVNPKTGKKEMFVRGTTFKRGGVEWLQNVAESPMAIGLGGQFVGDVSRHFRGKYGKLLTDIAKKERVDVIYGHSRGGAIVNDMNVKATKIGLDAATILNRRPAIRNYRQKQAFDALIGANAAKTVKTRSWVPFGSRRYHRYHLSGSRSEGKRRNKK